MTNIFLNKMRWLVLLGIFTLSLVFMGTAQAGILHVRTDGDDTASGASWSSAFKTIQRAIDEASTDDEIWVKAGTYPLAGGYAGRITVNKAVSIYGGFDGTETQRDQRDRRTNATAVDGQDQAYSCFYFQSADGATLDGFTITGGTTAPHMSGAGICIDACSPTIINCIIRGNKADGVGAGGGIASIGDGASPSITNCLIVENAAENGGAIYLANSNNPDNRPKITNCTITKNTTSNVAIPAQTGTAHFSSSYADVTNCIVWQNFMESGQEIFVDEASLNYVSVTYSNVWGGYTGASNWNVDPVFMGPDDFRLWSGSMAEGHFPDSP